MFCLLLFSAGPAMSAQAFSTDVMVQNLNKNSHMSRLISNGRDFS